jgi:hypothetical protein
MEITSQLCSPLLLGSLHSHGKLELNCRHSWTLKRWWTRGDSNPRPPHCERGITKAKTRRHNQLAFLEGRELPNSPNRTQSCQPTSRSQCRRIRYARLLEGRSAFPVCPLTSICCQPKRFYLLIEREFVQRGELGLASSWLRRGRKCRN